MHRASEEGDAIGALLAPALAMLAVMMQRDRAADRMVGAVTLVAEFDVEILVEEAPPQKHGLAGKIGIDLVEGAADADSRVAPDLAALRFAREGAEPLPAAHFAHAIGRQILEPILDPRMRFRAVLLCVVLGEVALEPAIGLRLGLGLVEMIERLVRFLDGAEWAFDPRVMPEGRLLPFERAVGRRPSLPAGRWVSTATPRCSIALR